MQLLHHNNTLNQQTIRRSNMANTNNRPIPAIKRLPNNMANTNNRPIPAIKQDLRRRPNNITVSLQRLNQALGLNILLRRSTRRLLVNIQAVIRTTAKLV
jgi:hypothetical protein